MTIELKEWGAKGNLELGADAVRALANAKQFEIAPDREVAGRWRVSATRYVGVAAIGGHVIRVAPKIPVHRLFELLTHTMHLVEWRSEAADWEESDDLISVIAASFLDNAERALRGGMLQGYVTVTDDLYSVRGRIDFGRLSGRPRELPLPVAVTYDDYTTDVLENQLLAGAGRVLLRLGMLTPALTRRLRRLEFQLVDITPARPSASPAEVRWTRLNVRYRTAVTLARLILQSTAFDFEGEGSSRGSTLLVNMDRVFEDVVGRGIDRALSPRGLTVDLQHRGHLDYEKRIDIRPDVVVFDGSDVVAVADLKNKRTGALSTGDVYQAVAYATRYRLTEVWLIYPEPPPYDEVTVGEVRVRLLSVDISLPPVERQYAMLQVAENLVSKVRSSIV
ncbi:hypothetical protein IF188_12595 [Microbacterium sp. NEAU-LLC]|uniref:5-methylcytosine-specific restriction enzyme subunit McrC n=1 Tax=Microbacterium helvum TaxID=2773713 RepID=A0ABR8NPG0_9MICO|nr:hypothetical protein [Microbacterium helvum]MBD3942537.1 hypothetical protein [Microbacterium helvum]